MPKSKTFAPKYSGWSTRGRPFSPTEWKRSYLRKNTKGSYANYLASYARQYKNKKLRKNLIS